MSSALGKSFPKFGTRLQDCTENYPNLWHLRNRARPEVPTPHSWTPGLRPESGGFEKENYLKGNREPRTDVGEASEASAGKSRASVASQGPGGRKRAPAPGERGATTHPYSPTVPVVALRDSAPAGGAPPPPAARGGLSGREEAAAQVSVSAGQRSAPRGAGCKGGSLVPCAP